MPNNYFKFKQMTIGQANSAMKVSTDACIQGAWTKISPNCNRILDIGCGTGLLSLMLAQRQPIATIEALEIDANAAQDAKSNFEQSPWANRLTLHLTNALDWEQDRSFDLIICNPPFFSNSLKGPDAQRNLARHNDSLSFEALSKMMSKYLSANGQASILLPYEQLTPWQNIAQLSGLHIHECLYIKSFAHSNAKRVVLMMQNQTCLIPQTEELIIYQSDKTYTAEFTTLMKDFYLYL